jgi:hypothetical protein
LDEVSARLTGKAFCYDVSEACSAGKARKKNAKNIGMKQV